jgi:hypothetical protein
MTMEADPVAKTLCSSYLEYWCLHFIHGPPFCGLMFFEARKHSSVLPLFVTVSQTEYVSHILFVKV